MNEKLCQDPTYHSSTNHPTLLARPPPPFCGHSVQSLLQKIGFQSFSLSITPQFDGDAIESAPLVLVDTPPKTKSKNNQTVAKIFLLLVSLILPNCLNSSGQSQAAFEDVSEWFMNLIYRFPIMQHFESWNVCIHLKLKHCELILRLWLAERNARNRISNSTRFG